MIVLAITAVLLAILTGYSLARWRIERTERWLAVGQLHQTRDQLADASALAADRLGLVEELRGDLADAQADLAAQAAAETTVPATDDPPAATAGPGEQEGHNFPTEPEAEPDPEPEQDLGDQLDDAPAASPPAPGCRALTPKQQALVDAVNQLGEASTSQVAHAVGRDGESIAVGSALKALRDAGLVSHNGKLAKAARWLALERTTVKPERRLPEITDDDKRLVGQVVMHGPVSADWVADQLVKNRRETAARMRELARLGWLVDLDGGMFASSPEQAEAA